MPPNTNLHFISNDGDYFSKINTNKFNSFLSKEWKEANKSDIIFYKRLSSFLAELLPNIKFTYDLDKESAIEKLERSTNFRATHAAIAKLKKFEDFSEEQVLRLINAAYNNTQVGWIMYDDDLLKFYCNLVSSYDKYIPLEVKKDLIEQLQPDSINESELVPSDSEPPF